ncbi:hypothetical protein ACOME3_009728 [Neoechinorhynchus agilis]
MTAADICGGFTIKLGEIDMSRGDSLLLIDEGSPMSVVTSDLRSYLGACLRQIQRRKFVLIAILILIYLYATVWRPESQQWRRRPPSYNSVYPLTPPKRHKDGMVTFAITIVADMDLDSSVGDKGYRSWMHKGFLNISSTILKAASNSESFTSLLNGENCVVSVVLDSPSPSALMSGFG